MSAKSFITNAQSSTLKKRLEQLVQYSKELKFLVGFFYFSGWRELYESLKARENLGIKLLVGLDVDRALGLVLEVEQQNSSLSNDELAERFFASMHIALNDENLDNQEFYEQVSFFLELIEQSRLQIRKTLEPNHAKLYFFKMDDEVKGLLPDDGKFITGSSNLTRAGIHGQNEFNVEIGDYGTDDAEAYFDELWESAIPITEVPTRKADLTRIVRNKTQVADVLPYEAYALVLKSYLELMEQKTIKPYVLRLLEKHGFREYKYQVDAVNQALTIVEQYNGVIIADVVGLGKSVIAGMLARNLGKRGMVLCPPGLMGDAQIKDSGWHKYMQDFELPDWEVRSSGDLDKAAKFLDEHGDDIEVIIVDEAHRFRNEDTQDYEWLSAICKNRIVILLTATPFNNSPQDIFAMLKLFIVPGKSRITLDENLDARFAKYNGDFKRISYISRYYNSPDPEKRERAAKMYMELFDDLPPVDITRVKTRATILAKLIRAVLEPILIRRNRLDLKNDPIYSTEVSELSVVEDPCELFYELSPEQMAFYDKVLKEYFSEEGKFHGAIYQPFLYEKSKDVKTGKLDENGNRQFQQQRNLFEFMRRLLVKRFESSFGAFAKSIDNFVQIHTKVLEFIQTSGGRYILDRSLIEKIYNGTAEDIETALVDFAEYLASMTKLPKNQKIYYIDKFDAKEQFLKDIQSDLALLQEISAMIAKLDLVGNDPKAECLLLEIQKVISKAPKAGEPQRKVIIFSEYLDTVKHLRPMLEKAFDGKVYTLDGNLNSSAAREILENFDASVKEEKQANDYQILLTSDKLSEGVNLNRAGAIINYDIPWNPTRVIQRVGRINRIGKKVFDSLYLFNFFPTEKGSDIIKSRDIASQKMFLIHNILGEDVKIFAMDETPNPAELFKRINTTPDEEDDLSTLTLVRTLFHEIEQDHPEVIQKISQYPARVKSAKAHVANQLLVYRRKGLGMFIQQVDDAQAEKVEVHPILFEDALPCIQCGFDEARLKLSQQFWPAYEAIKAYKENIALPKSDAAIESKALNNLQTALFNFKEELELYLPFIRTLVLDIRDYKTLPKSTLRRLSSVELVKGNEKSVKDFSKELDFVRTLLGENYLERIKTNLGSMKSEVIIAIENQVK